MATYNQMTSINGIQSPIVIHLAKIFSTVGLASQGFTH